MKINKKYSPYIFASIMNVLMGFFMTFFLTWMNAGFVDDFFFIWIRSFAVAICVAFPISLLVAPLAQAVVSKIVAGE
jgi:hypothetical protein